MIACSAGAGAGAGSRLHSSCPNWRWRRDRRRLARVQLPRIGECRAQNANRVRRVDVRVGELVRFLHRAVEVCADDVAVKIGDDEQRRIKRRFPIAEKLLVGFFEVFARPFVFSAQAIAAILES